MRATKFFGLGIFGMVYALVLFLAVETGFFSVTWAGKPPHAGKPRKYRTECGYAMFQNVDGDIIKSDNRGRYVDKRIEGGEDEVMLHIYEDDNSLRSSITFLGEVENQSSRKVNFLFDFLNDADTKPGDGQAVYDILVWIDGSRTTRRGNQVEEKYYLNDDTVHTPIIVHAESRDRVQFVVDPDWNGTSPNAITQETVNVFYDNDGDINYWVNDFGHIIYTLYYDSEFIIEGAYPEWTITAIGSVRLSVSKISSKGKGKSKPVEEVILTTYTSLPFGYTTGYVPPSSAPQKNNTLSTIWGKVKEY